MNGIIDAIEITKSQNIQRLKDKKNKRSLSTECILAVWKLASLSYNEKYPTEKIKVTATVKAAGIFKKHAKDYFSNSDDSWVEFLEDTVQEWKDYLPFFAWMRKGGAPPTPDLQFIAMYFKYFIQYSQQSIKTDAKNAKILADKKEPGTVQEGGGDAASKQARLLAYERSIQELQGDVAKLQSLLKTAVSTVGDLKFQIEVRDRKYSALLIKAQELGYDMHKESRDAIYGDYELPPKII